MAGKGKQNGTLILLIASFCLVLIGCKIPASMAPTFAKRATTAWQKVSYNDQKMIIHPDTTDLPDKIFTVRYRDRKLASPENGWRYVVEKPDAQKGFSIALDKTAVWMRLATGKGLMVLDGLPVYNADRARELLTRVIRQTLETTEFDAGRIEFEGIKALRITSTPDPWTDRCQFKSITITDLDTRVIKQAQEFDQEGNVRQTWKIVQYQRGVPHPDSVYQVPAPANGEPFLPIDLAGGQAWDRQPIEGLALFVHPTQKGVHHLQSSDFGPVMVSNYSDGLNHQYLIQLPQDAPPFQVPWSRKVNLGGRTTRVCLVDGFIFVSFAQGPRRGLILAQDNLPPVLHFLEELDVVP